MTPVNILIVDDREENVIALDALLDRDDIRKFTTTSPNEALRIAWNNPIDIALVDVQMPDMDGFELVEMLKSNDRTKNIIVIFVTAISKEAKYVMRGLDSGAVDYLYKPLDPTITAAKVDSFIRLVRSQAEVRRQNEELQNFALVIKNSADVICMVDPEDFRIKNINPAIEKMLGFTPAEMIGSNILDKVAESSQLIFRKKLDSMVIGNYNFTVFEFQFYTADQRTLWAECRASYHNHHLFLNISDISPAKSYQGQLIRSKEAAEYSKKIKETFLANMSHELRTPVAGIIGLADMLRKSGLNEQQSHMLSLLETSSQSLLGVINDVLDFSKIEAGKFNIVRSPADLAALLNAVSSLLKFKADKKDIELFLEIDAGLPRSVMADSLRINQILMNLMGNAINFTERGYVKLKAEVLKMHSDRAKIRFTVEDTGIGIAANKLNKIFESFEQADDDTANHYGGTGLGLTIVKRLVELMGGELNVTSQVGKGTVFTFTNWFNLSETPKAVTESRPAKALPSLNGVRILVAEDNAVNQFMLAKLLKDWKAEADIVENGRLAFEKLKENDYDLILMDTHMPEMNGYEATKKIRLELGEPKSSIPVISLSAATLDHEQNEALAAGMNDVLAKPYQPYQLHEKIKKMLQLQAIKTQA